jgi:hypothetical protein
MNLSKNQNRANVHFEQMANRAIITLTLFVLIFLSLRTSAQGPVSQKIKLSIGYETFSTGNAHGGFTAPSISLTKSLNQLIFAPTIQYQSKKIDGLRVCYSRNLSGTPYKADATDPEDHYDGEFQSVLQLNLFAYAQYVQDARLSSNAIRNEQMIHRESSTNYGQIRLNTAETGIGIELRVNINHFLCWRNYVGAGVYSHLNYVKGLDHEKQSTSLLLGTGLQYNF